MDLKRRRCRCRTTQITVGCPNNIKAPSANWNDSVCASPVWCGGALCLHDTIRALRQCHGELFSPSHALLIDNTPEAPPRDHHQSRYHPSPLASLLYDFILSCFAPVQCPGPRRSSPAASTLPTAAYVPSNGSSLYLTRASPVPLFVVHLPLLFLPSPEPAFRALALRAATAGRLEPRGDLALEFPPPPPPPRPPPEPPRPPPPGPPPLPPPG